jgi:hypothetical protein
MTTRDYLNDKYRYMYVQIFGVYYTCIETHGYNNIVRG